jgi:hypothetical protein
MGGLNSIGHGNVVAELHGKMDSPRVEGLAKMDARMGKHNPIQIIESPL